MQDENSKRGIKPILKHSWNRIFSTESRDLILEEKNIKSLGKYYIVAIGKVDTAEMDFIASKEQKKFISGLLSPCV